MSVSKIATTAATATEVKNTNPETQSLVSTTFSGEPTPPFSGPTKLGGNKDQRKQSEEKGKNNTLISTMIFSVQFTFFYRFVSFHSIIWTDLYNLQKLKQM